MVDQTGGHLHVEERRGPAFDRVEDEAEFLAAGVDDRGAAGLGEEPPEGLEIAGREGVDGGEDAGGRYLHETELAAVGVLRDELGVEAEVRVAGESVDQIAELGVASRYTNSHAITANTGRSTPTL